MRAPGNIRLTLVNATLAVCGIALLLCLFEATTETNYALTGYALLAALCLAGGLSVFHLQRALFRAGPKMIHCSLVAVIMLILFGVFPICVKRHATVLRRAFLERRVRGYDAMAAKIIANRGSLTERYRDMEKLVGRPAVFARSDEDGSVSIRFCGRVNGSKFDALGVGYFYHSGPMIPKPDDTNYYTLRGLKDYQYHLTNGWYEE